MPKLSRSIVVPDRSRPPLTQRSGVCTTIIEAISRKSGASLSELIDILAKKFPERRPESMATTAKCQANLHATHKMISEARGRVYYRREGTK